MPSRLDLTANMDGNTSWNRNPYYDKNSLAGISEAPLEWTFDNEPAILPSQTPSIYHDYASPFSNSVFEGLPDITWDQTSPETTHPTTPSSPSYPLLPTIEHAPDVDTAFTSGVEAQQYPTPRLLPQPHSPFEFSMQHRLRGYQHRRGRQTSPQLGFGQAIAPYHPACGPCVLSALPEKRERSPNVGLDFTLGVHEDDNTPDLQFDETDADATAGSEPYAQLIYRALKSVPGHSMVLKDIYEWFEKNTDKPQTSTSAKGWQNSIRHNLSMNGAFNKVDQVPPAEDSKKGFIWVLADSALEEGVKSTTRYRKHNLHKKSCKTEHPAPQRQISGAKGGKAAKKSAMLAGKMPTSKTKRSSRAGRTAASYAKDFTTSPSSLMAFEEYKRHLRELEQQQRERMRTFHSPFEQHTTQSYLHAPSTTPISSVPEPRLFQLSDVVGCADLGFAPLFYDEPTGDQEDGLASSQSLNSPADMYIDYNLGGIAT